MMSLVKALPLGAMILGKKAGGHRRGGGVQTLSSRDRKTGVGTPGGRLAAAAGLRWSCSASCSVIDVAVAQIKHAAILPHPDVFFW